ncbi:MAG: hypothetical protein J6Y85_04135 [Alphaproteobacteria bacterium]|nr:hypothetical protein [Alphaproteobacteria bacterium]
MRNRTCYFYFALLALAATACSIVRSKEETFYCDAGDVKSIFGVQNCCRGYRADSNNWSGFNGYQCCPAGTSVNGFGECIACGAGQHYNMGYADLQHKQDGKAACGQRCTKNEDCPEDRFCYMDAHVTGADSQISPIVGTCVTPQDVGGIVGNEVMVDGQSAGYWMGPKNYMDWWSARNFCMRYGKVDLPTRKQICGDQVEQWQACPSPLRIALEETIGSKQQAPHFWLETTDSGKAYYVDPKAWAYVVKVPPEVTARTRSAGVVCGPINVDNVPENLK